MVPVGLNLNFMEITSFHYDKIIFIENGNITGVGSHLELLENHKLYAKFIEYQTQK